MKLFKKIQLKKGIKKDKKTILVLEQKRLRSQSALVDAILTNSVPNDDDVEWFNDYTRKINNVRDHMIKLENELKNL